LRKFIWKILRFFRLAGLIQLSYKGILDELGWLKSFNSMQSVDREGNPIPWCTYSFIHFITYKLTPDLSVFEFGSGNSTIWYAQRVKKIIAVEHDLNWISKISKKIPQNATILHKELDTNGLYAKTAISTDQKFDIIIIDGRDRNNCVYNSLQALTDNGILIFDNSQRPEYIESQDFLKLNGYKRIDFRGLCPTVAHINTTTIFYRDNNCIHI
jgi:predicted O-methyltransferase YrrM